MAYQDQEITQQVFKGKEIQNGSMTCPKCRINLEMNSYEGVQIYQCRFCRGSLLSRKDAEKIIMRREIGFSSEVIKIAEKMTQKDQLIFRAPKLENLYSCQNCKGERKMLRKFYNLAYFVEIDECIYCGYLWFDSPELEVLQYLIEKHASLSNS